MDRALDDTLGLTGLADGMPADGRTGRNGLRGVMGLMRRSIRRRLAGYEDANDATGTGAIPPRDR